MHLLSGLLLFFLSVSLHLNSEQSPKLNYQPISHFHTPKGISAIYQLHPENFPKNVPLKLIVEMLDGSKEVIENLQINEKGILVKNNDPRTFFILRENMALGESTRYTLSNKEGTKKVGVTIVPLPIEAKDTMGHRVSIELLSPDGMTFLCHGEGFFPTEEVKMILNSGKELVVNKTKASTEGKFVAMLSPGIKNQASGYASVEVISKMSKLKLHYKWGRPATHSYLP